ncbi:hypothetical protein M2323_002731 [Rhodoblastus acidophilus]|uniref:hypothetical protein n=1 Tax=Rhodoblastus acidophilus TaxID=1074 RepID=UPI002224A651|nr:hypothetical protein [Rhodoblastus acidophilus]MCW2284915.1 hypothetical protein [Rhodoblastus acidophilus]MCW2333795.1 hypothetical protein [Rhodoblastus acidophilus]
MKANRKERGGDAPAAPERRPSTRRKAIAKRAAPVAVVSEVAPIMPEAVTIEAPAAEVRNLPAVIPCEPLDVSVAVASMAATSARINRHRPFVDWDLLAVAAAVLAAGFLKLAVLAII